MSRGNTVLLTRASEERARRKIGAERLKAFSNEQQRQERKEAFRSKRGRARVADRWWFNIQLIATSAVGLLVYHFLPFKLPDEWEDAALVTFLCTVVIGFTFRELWRGLGFWVSLAISALAQLWVIKVVNPSAHWRYKNASFVTGFAVGFLVWGTAFLLLRAVISSRFVSADFNGDGKLDLAVGEIGSLNIFLGNGDGTFASLVSYSAGTNPVSLALGDFNADRKLNIAAEAPLAKVRDSITNIIPVLRIVENPLRYMRFFLSHETLARAGEAMRNPRIWSGSSSGRD